MSPFPAAIDPIADLCERTARRTIAQLVKQRARWYARRPFALDALHPGLSAAAPGTLIAIAEHLVERERRSPRRWFGFGGEVTHVNARAALLLGRVERRSATKVRRHEKLVSGTPPAEQLPSPPEP